MNDKKIYILLGALVLLFGVVFVLGIRTGRRSTRSKIAELEATISELDETVNGLESTVRDTAKSYNELREIHDADTATVEELTVTIGQLENVVTAQRSIIDEATGASIELGESSTGLTEGLVRAVGTVDEAIAILEAGKN